MIVKEIAPEDIRYCEECKNVQDGGEAMLNTCERNRKLCYIERVYGECGWEGRYYEEKEEEENDTM